MADVAHILVMLIAEGRVIGAIDDINNVMEVYGQERDGERERVEGERVWAASVEGVQEKFFQGIFFASTHQQYEL